MATANTSSLLHPGESPSKFISAGITPSLPLLSVLPVLLKDLVRYLLLNVTRTSPCPNAVQPSGHRKYPSHEKNQAKNLSSTNKIPRQVSRSQWDHLRQLITIKTPRREERCKQRFF